MFRSPKVPEPRPVATPTSPTAPGAQQGDSQAQAFRGFRFAPQLAAFNPRRAGRRSMIGGSGSQ